MHSPTTSTQLNTKINQHSLSTTNSLHSDIDLLKNKAKLLSSNTNSSNIDEPHLST